jgi:uncharacterized protein
VQFTVITDPAFYAVAVPAVLLTAVSKSGFGGGFGALAVPLMALSLPVPQAAAIMLPLLAAMDILGLGALMRSADRALLRLLIPAGLLGTLIGTLLFGVLSTRVVSVIVGVVTLVFLAQRLFFPARADAPPPGKAAGVVLGVLSGFTSFVAHAGAPPVSFFLLPQRLDPVRFTATMAVLFAVINASKWIPYGFLGLIDGRNLGTALVLMPLVPFGVWIGLRLVKRIDPTWFYRLIHLGMLLTGLKLILS